MIVPDFSMTTLEAAMSNALAAVKIQVGQFNDQLKSNYLAAFSNWTQNVIAGRIDNSNPPHPPMAYELGFFTDPTNDQAHWAYPVQGKTPVCDTPPLPPASKPYVPPVMPEPDHIRNVPAGDNMPVGFVANGPDGSRWQKQASPTPFGIAYYYQKVG